MELERLDAPHNDYAYAEIPKHPFLYGTGKTGMLPDSAKRGNPSNNLVTQLRGGTPWRYPSSYMREIRVFSDVASYKTSSTSGWRLPGGNLSGAILLTNIPGYWQNMNIDIDQNLVNEADTEALLSIKGESAQIGLQFAEAKRTFELLSSSAITLMRAYRAARRGSWSQVGNILGLTRKDILSGRYPANKWLEYQYGWKPLLSDIHNTYERFRERLKSNAFLVYGKGYGHKSFKLEDVRTKTTSDPNYKRSRFGEQILVTKLTAELSSQRWRDAAQFGLMDPLSIGWELVPFSFVLDWFMPVGNVLEALTARAGLNFISGVQICVSGGYTKLVTLPTTSPTVRIHGSLTCKRFGTIRTRLYDWPEPMFYAAESPFSTKRSLNALALWRLNLKFRFH